MPRAQGAVGGHRVERDDVDATDRHVVTDDVGFCAHALAAFDWDIDAGKRRNRTRGPVLENLKILLAPSGDGIAAGVADDDAQLHRFHGCAEGRRGLLRILAGDERAASDYGGGQSGAADVNGSEHGGHNYAPSADAEGNLARHASP